MKTMNHQMNRIMKNWIFLLLVALLITAGCEPKDDDPRCFDPGNPECENYDPCFYSPGVTTAAFRIIEPSGAAVEDFEFDEPIPYKPLESDTVLRSDITFTALDMGKGADFTWYIGREVLKGRTVTRRSFPENEDIPITLVVRREPDLDCFPNDDGYDSLTRVMYRLPWGSRLSYEGTWEGYVEGHNEPVTIYIETDSMIIRPNYRGLGPVFLWNLYPYEAEYVGYGSPTGPPRPPREIGPYSQYIGFRAFKATVFSCYPEYRSALGNWEYPFSTDSLGVGLFHLYAYLPEGSDTITVDYLVHKWDREARIVNPEPERYTFRGTLKR